VLSPLSDPDYDFKYRRPIYRANFSSVVGTQLHSRSITIVYNLHYLTKIIPRLFGNAPLHSLPPLGRLALFLPRGVNNTDT